MSVARDIFNLHDSELSKACSTYKARTKELEHRNWKEAGRPLWKCGCSFECSKICNDVDWIKVTQDRIQWRLVKPVMHQRVI
jgi:hypothetical protein